MLTKENNTYPLNSFTYADVADGCAVRCPTGVTSAVFRSQFKASRVSSHTDECNETVCL